MVHSWAEATDGTGSALRVYLFDYRKAFDLINHRILAKVSLLSMPLFVKRWVIDFLMKRQQRVKLAKECLSEWANIPSGVPQGRKLGPCLFLFMINNAVDSVQPWSTTNRLQLNVAKCKELVISLSKTVNNFPSLNIDSGQLEVVMNARILGLTISNNLKWNDHMANIIKKANKPLYFIVQLKCTKVPEQDIITFYVTCVRPVLE